MLSSFIRPISLAIAGILITSCPSAIAASPPAIPTLQASAVPRSQPSPKQSAADANLPMPDDARNISRLPSPGTGSVNFQTNLSLQDALAFYRQRMAQRGLRERTAHTTASTFTISFEGWPNSNARLIVEGTDLGGVATNVNLHFETP
jgi:hypothetical protein